MEALGINPSFILVMIVAFVLLVFILQKFAFGPILGMLAQRQTTIQGNFDEAEARRAEMVSLQKEYQTRLAGIEDQARDQIQAAVREAQAAREEMLNRAREESAQIVARAQTDIERERQKAMVEMRDQIAELAVAAATRVVKQNLDAQNHARLIDDVIAGLGQNGNLRPAGNVGGMAGGSA